MPRKLAWLLSLATLALVLALTVSCGSSNSTTSTACTGGPYNVVGDWNGTFTGSGGTTSAIGAIDSAGLALFFDSTGDTAQLPALTGTCSFSGTETIYASFVDGGGSISGTAQGNVASDSSITGTESINGSSGNIALTSTTPLTAPASALSGAWTGNTGGGGDFFNLTFSPTGTGSGMSFTGTDLTSGCTVSGTLTQQGSSNVFDVSYSISAGGSCVASTSSGIAFETNTDYFDFNGNAQGTYLYADILGPSGAFVLEIY